MAWRNEDKVARYEAINFSYLKDSRDRVFSTIAYSYKGAQLIGVLSYHGGN